MNDLEKMLSRIKAEHHSSTQQTNYKCPKCRDSTFVMTLDENGNKVAKRCVCFAVSRARELIEQSGISEEFNRKTFDNFDTKGLPQLINAKSKAERYAEDFTKFEGDRYNSILFSGQAGAGKTHLGIAICGVLLNAGIAVVYMAYRSAVTRIKQNITDEQAYNGELRKYIAARVLYIDDLLKGRLTETDVNILYDIVNHRYMNNMPIIVSTEKSLSELILFDEAIGSRLLEMCKCNIIQLQGKELNYRLYS